MPASMAATADYVRLAEAREIADLYDSDHDFREHVSRYIHDFEAMLRTMLSTRDGNAVIVDNSSRRFVPSTQLLMRWAGL